MAKQSSAGKPARRQSILLTVAFSDEQTVLARPNSALPKKWVVGCVSDAEVAIFTTWRAV
jgi:hypothetical protein